MLDGHDRLKLLRDVGELRVTVSSGPRAYTIALCGELDLASRGSLDDALKDAEAAHAQVIVLDLRGLDFIDSAGLHTIADAYRQARGRRIVLTDPGQVRRMFELCGLNELLTIPDQPTHRQQAHRSSVPSRTDGATNLISHRLPRVNLLGTARRVNQAALAAAIRELRSRGPIRSIR
jgi:anti-anti-sigma factor